MAVNGGRAGTEKGPNWGHLIKVIELLLPTSFCGSLICIKEFVRPEKWGDSQVGFRGRNASGGRIVLLPGAFWAHGAFQNGHFGRISSTLYFTVFRSFGGHASARRVSLEPCFRQAHCFVQGPLRFLPVPPNPTCARSHIWGLPKSASGGGTDIFAALRTLFLAAK